MPDAPKKPCCICRRWFRPDPRIGSRQRACRNPNCQATRRVQTQESWRERHPDYFFARRIQERGNEGRSPEPLRLPPPLSRLPWDIAQDEFGVQGTDFIGILSTVLLRVAQDQFKAHPTDKAGLADTLHSSPAQDQIRPVGESVRVGKKRNEAGVSSTGPPL
jgi:hypothetical protein